jgi:hypothetical protein
VDLQRDRVQTALCRRPAKPVMSREEGHTNLFYLEDHEDRTRRERATVLSPGRERSGG